MTEQQWLTSDNPSTMLEHMTRNRTEEYPGMSDRKLRLFACGCVRQSWQLLDQKSRHVVEVAEKFADGKTTKEETFRLASSCMTIARCLMPTWDSTEEAKAIIDTARVHNTARLPEYVSIFRDVVGNPFKKVKWWKNRKNMVDLGPGTHESWVPYDHVKPWLVWNDRTVTKLARKIYDEQAFHEMPLLADALLDAGCDDESVLEHCRGNKCRLCNGRGVIERPIICGPDLSEEEMRRIADEAGSPIICPSCRNIKPNFHVRGCWVLDLILGLT